jgi:hypothetical protein
MLRVSFGSKADIDARPAGLDVRFVPTADIVAPELSAPLRSKSPPLTVNKDADDHRWANTTRRPPSITATQIPGETFKPDPCVVMKAPGMRFRDALASSHSITSTARARPCLAAKQSPSL